MIEDKQYKTVAIKYSDDKPTDLILLVTDISYHDAYIKIQYMESIDKEETKIVAMNGVKDIVISELDKFDAHRTLMHLAERTAGTDFTKIMFNPCNGDKSIVSVTSCRNTVSGDFHFEKVTKIERKWDHDRRGHNIVIHTIHKDPGPVWSGVEAIYIFDESDIKSLLIGRSGMKDIKVDVNGGKYNDY